MALVYPDWSSGGLACGPGDAGPRGFGCFGNVAMGVIGALIGGFLFRYLGVSAGGTLGSLVTAFVGAATLIFLIQLFKKV